MSERPTLSPERSQRFGRIVIGTMVTVALITAAGGIWGNRPFPALLSGLPRSAAEADKAFQALIKQRFPAGSRESEIEAELDRNGFSPAQTLPGGAKKREWQRWGLECTITAEVSWRSGNDGLISESDGKRAMICR